VGDEFQINFSKMEEYFSKMEEYFAISEKSRISIFSQLEKIIPEWKNIFYLGRIFSIWVILNKR
jgi:hypothetical protein